MRLNTGDKVRFLNDVGGGTVSRIEGTNLVYVLDEDGFEVPALTTELVLIEKKQDKHSSAHEENNNVSTESTFDYKESEDSAEPKMLFALTKDSDVGGNVKLYYINDSNYFAFYTISKVNKDLLSPLYNGLIEPNTKVNLDTLAINYINDNTLHVQVIFYKKDKDYKMLEPIIEKISFSGTKLMKDSYYTDNDYLESKAMLMPILKDSFEKKIEQLSDKSIKKAIKEKSDNAKAVKVKRRDDKEILEIDLHIHELLDDTRGLSNRDMLDTQMKKFHEIMAANEKNKRRKIVFIHGVGNGVLKAELRKALDRKYKWHDYQDASFQEYGWGATMVII